MDWINALIDSGQIPLLSALFIGLLTSVSPCPLATNVTAIAFISRKLTTPNTTFVTGLMYTLGRGFSYTLIATLIYFGWSSFELARFFGGWGDKVLGPVLIGIGLIMLGVIKINVGGNNETVEKIKLTLAEKGNGGAFLLGMLFALAFCPYSGVLFFGMLMPLILQTSEGLLLAPVFALGTGVPVLIFAVILAYGANHLSKAYQMTATVEKVMRYGVGGVFIISGVYYLRYLVTYLLSL